MTVALYEYLYIFMIVSLAILFFSKEKYFIRTFKRAENKTHFLYSTTVLLTQYCAGGKIETNEMGRACGAYGGG